jgi:hypothetical protein
LRVMDQKVRREGGFISPSACSALRNTMRRRQIRHDLLVPVRYGHLMTVAGRRQFVYIKASMRWYSGTVETRSLFGGVHRIAEFGIVRRIRRDFVETTTPTVTGCKELLAV